MEKIKKIDIHAHINTPCALGLERMPFPAVEVLLDAYDRLGIERGVLLPFRFDGMPSLSVINEEYKEAVREHSDRFLWFCGIDPREYDDKRTLERDLEAYVAHGARGVGEMTANVYVDDPVMERFYEVCQACEIPLLVHFSTAVGLSYGIVDDIHLPRVEKILEKYPRLKFIGHSQPFWAEISADLDEKQRMGYPTGKVTEGCLTRLMRKYENLSCDLSAGSGAGAMLRDPDFAFSFMEEFSDRTFYGCDMGASVSECHYKLRDLIDEGVANGHLSLESYMKICRGNAEKLLGI